jgi:hypothetical protein
VQRDLNILQFRDTENVRHKPGREADAAGAYEGDLQGLTSTSGSGGDQAGPQ